MKIKFRVPGTDRYKTITAPTLRRIRIKARKLKLL